MFETNSDYDHLLVLGFPPTFVVVVTLKCPKEILVNKEK